MVARILLVCMCKFLRTCIDVAADGFGAVNLNKHNFFNARVFNPQAPSNRYPQSSTCYRKHENEKRVYEQ